MARRFADQNHARLSDPVVILQHIRVANRIAAIAARVLIDRAIGNLHARELIDEAIESPYHPPPPPPPDPPPPPPPPPLELGAATPAATPAIAAHDPLAPPPPNAPPPPVQLEVDGDDDEDDPNDNAVPAMALDAAAKLLNHRSTCGPRPRATR